MDIINIIQSMLDLLKIDMQFIIKLLELNIQTIGIFIAIIGGLVATKIISLNTEKDEIKLKKDQIDLEIEHISKYLEEKNKVNMEIYKNEVYEEMVDMIYDESCEYTIFDNYNPFIEAEEREKFKESIINLLSNKRDIIEKTVKRQIVTKEIFLKECKEEIGSIEYKILDYFYDKLEV
ncbi:MAG: hypothetical protein N2749_06635 [Clostridia bacterium]|nr:hypothetical protein [Clostridia bacterium]